MYRKPTYVWSAINVSSHLKHYNIQVVDEFYNINNKPKYQAVYDASENYASGKLGFTISISYEKTFATIIF